MLRHIATVHPAGFPRREETLAASTSARAPIPPRSSSTTVGSSRTLPHAARMAAIMRGYSVALRSGATSSVTTMAFFARLLLAVYQTVLRSPLWVNA